MLSERGNPQKGYLFVSQTKGKGEQLETRTINEAMKSLADKAGIRDFKTKALRSFYNSALLRADLKQECKDLMMGHERASARSHYDYDDLMIKEAYAKAFEYLSINGVQTRQDILKLKEEFSATKSELAELIANQQKHIARVVY
jgi:integrase